MPVRKYKYFWFWSFLDFKYYIQTMFKNTDLLETRYSQRGFILI